MNKSLPPLKTARVIELAGGKGGARQIANVLGLTTQAVYKWPLEVPLLRAYQLRQIRPDWCK